MSVGGEALTLPESDFQMDSNECHHYSALFRQGVMIYISYRRSEHKHDTQFNIKLIPSSSRLFEPINNKS